MRILNADALTSHGHIAGRRALVEILEAGLQAADPYHNLRRLLRREGDHLILNEPLFQPRDDPHAGPECIDLCRVRRVLVIGAGKGVQRMALVLEEVLGDRLTAGHVIDKADSEHILQRIGVTFGAHPVPDDACVRGCQRILALLGGLTADDLVFTCVANGVSSLLTLPVEGVSLEDVRRVTYLMQIERGAPTGDLNPVRNHLDQLKGGRLSARIAPARAIHLIAWPPGSYEVLTRRNRWLHTLPDDTTFAQAVEMLKRWEAWEAAPASVRAHLLRADPAQETLKPAAFERLPARIFGILPEQLGMLPTASARARELGLQPHILSAGMTAEASYVAQVVASIAQHTARQGEPFTPPCALLSGGEMVVTVGQERGMGGRNQEYALAAALRLAGSRQIVMGSVDSDGTDGPGRQFTGAGEMPPLAGGVVDGETVARARSLGIDLRAALRHHDASPALYRLDEGILATPNVSMNDLSVTLILGRD